MEATTHETVFDAIRDKLAELGQQCENGCSQLAGAEARLRTLLGTRRDLMASPGSPFLLAEEISKRSREAVAILMERQKSRAVVESEIRGRLAERRRLSSEIRNVSARLNEKTWRLQEIEARAREELSKDPHYLGLKSHLRDLEESLRDGRESIREGGAVAESEARAPRPSFLSRMLGLAALRSGGTRRDPPVPAAASAGDPGNGLAEKIDRVRGQLLRKEISVKEREGSAPLETQREGLADKMTDLLEAEEVSRRSCQNLFRDWRELQEAGGRDLPRALQELDRCLESEAASPPPGAQVRSQLGRLRELSELIETACLENERLSRNCDRTFSALERVMELEGDLWRRTGPGPVGGVDFTELLGDLDLEARPAVKRAEVGGVARDAAPAARTTESEGSEKPRFRQFKLWEEG